jgi:hypothetical protein
MATPSVFDGMDDATAALILQLELENTEGLERGFKGKYTTGKPPDGELAFKLQKEQLERDAAILRDREVAARLDPHGRVTTQALQGITPPPARINAPPRVRGLVRPRTAAGVAPVPSTALQRGVPTPATQSNSSLAASSTKLTTVPIQSTSSAKKGLAPLPTDLASALELLLSLKPT